jgi:hypothetical protein
MCLLMSEQNTVLQLVQKRKAVDLVATVPRLETDMVELLISDLEVLQCKE